MDPEAVDEVSDSAHSDSSASPLCRTTDSSCRQYAGSQPQLLDFSAIINAETPDGISQVYESALVSAQSHPSDDYSGFRATAAEYVECEATEVIPTAGRLAGVRLVTATTISSGDPVLLPAPSCSEYAREVRLQGGSLAVAPHTELFDTDPAEFQLVCACQPNNPTGHLHEPDVVRAYADRCLEAGTPLLLDESFLDFSGSASLAGYPGVIVVRSLSPISGLPGLHSGFVVASEPYQERLATARLTWGLSVPGREVGEYCMNQTEFLDATKARIKRERNRLRDRLSPRFDVLHSGAPYLLFELPADKNVSGLQATLRESNIAIRDARTFRNLDNHVRVTIRSPEENDALLEALGV